MSIPGVDAVTAPVRSVRSWLGDPSGRRNRRVSVVGGQAHVEVRGLQDVDRSDLREAAQQAVERIDGVDWAEVDAVVGRLVLVFDPDAVDLDDVIGTIEDVEDAHDTADERFPHDRPDHPGDREPMQRQLFAIAADSVGLGFATAGQVLRLARIPAEIPGVIALVDSQPRVRRLLEDRLGPPATDILVASTNALVQALGQGPIGLVADIANRSGLVAEHLARRDAWNRREPELITGRNSVRHGPVDIPPRPVPLPKGPVERYADGAAIASLGIVGATFGATRNPRRSVDLLLTGVPKAATLGREAYAAWLGVSLARRGVLVMDPKALRRLDRATTLAIDARLVTYGRWAIEEVRPLETVEPKADPLQAAARARSLFNPADPTAVRRRASWVLAPWASDPRAPRGTATRARELRRGGRRVLALWRGDKLAALVSVAEDPAPMAVALVADARAIGLEVILAGGNDALAERLGGVGRWTGADVAAEIRDHQAVGRVVVYASGRSHRGLVAADVAIGVETPGHKAPLGAEIVIRRSLGEGWLIIAAIRAAKRVSRRSALFAAAGTSAGTAWALLGAPRTAATRTMLGVNISALGAMAHGATTGLQVGATPVPRADTREAWHELDPRAVLSLIGTTRDGLGAAERDERRRVEDARDTTGPVGLAQAAWEELANPLTPLLGLGAALSAAVGSVTDAGLVLGVVASNALVGAVQRVQTERSLADLEADGVPIAHVLVDGTRVELPADQVVIGDVLHLEAGDTVPADCRILGESALEVDESTLTGESLPVAKSARATPGAAVPERTCMIYEGTVIAAGTATAVVIAVGADTEAGRSAAAAGTPPPSGVEQRLRRLTDLTVPVTVGAGVATTGLSFLMRRPAREAVGTGVSLMVAAVPEGLPALATLAQVAAARRLAGRHALVRNPRAIEALGRVQQVCFDKTGTLTEGTLSVVAVSDGRTEDTLDALTAARRPVLAAARRATPDHNGGGTFAHGTDGAVAAAADATRATPRGGWTRAAELPFESRRGLHAVLGHRAGTWAVDVKGAPEVVLAGCTSWQIGRQRRPLDAEATRELEDHAHQLARRGLRVLAVATGEVSPDARLEGTDDLPPMTFLGYVALADVVRPSARAAVDTLQRAGVHLAMITGDHPTTAEAIAVELGMLNGGLVLTGPELDQLDDDELDLLIGRAAVFARVTPLQKVRIVASYQRIGRPVAMTGDGANDAAAIRLADAGIALGGRGTDAARRSADVVVVDDRIETIVDAVVEGRAMWESVRAAVAILVGGNLGEMGFTLAGTALGGSAPLNPRQLLLVNLLTDLAPALAIALREPPDRSAEALLHAGPDESLGFALTRDIAVRAGATAGAASIAWGIARLTGTPTRARTVGLAALVGTQLAQTLVAGGPTPMVWGATAVSTGVLVVVIQTPGLSQFFGCRPLGPVGWGTAVYATTTATAASIVVPWAVEGAGRAIVRGATGAGGRVQRHWYDLRRRSNAEDGLDHPEEQAQTDGNESDAAGPAGEPEPPSHPGAPS